MRFFSKIAFVRLIVVSGLVFFMQADAALGFGLGKSNRPRQWWEYDPGAGPSDVDHLGLGWDDLYMARLNSDKHKKAELCKAAEKEFVYTLTHNISTEHSNRDLGLLIGLTNGLAEAAFHTGNTLQAKNVFDFAIRSFPKVPALYGYYATYLNRINCLPEAIVLLERAVAILPEDATLHYHLGLLYCQAKQYDRARKEASIARKIGGVNIGQLEEKIGQAHDAEHTESTR